MSSYSLIRCSISSFETLSVYFTFSRLFYVNILFKGTIRPIFQVVSQFQQYDGSIQRQIGAKSSDKGKEVGSKVEGRPVPPSGIPYKLTGFTRSVGPGCGSRRPAAGLSRIMFYVYNMLTQ